MKKPNKFLSLLFLAVMIFTMGVSALADNSGKIGENANWSFDSSTGTFTVSGTGSLYPFTFDDDTLEIDSPCDKYYTQVKKIVIEEGITALTSYSLWACECKEIHIPKSVKKIARGSFMIITADDNVNVYYAGTEKEWNQLDKGPDFYFKEAIMHYGATSAATVTKTASVAKATTSSDSIKVYIDNKIVSFDVQPQLIGGRTMVPLRAIFEGLGATVEWNNSTQTVTAYNETTIVKATIGEYTMNVNGTAKSIDVPPMLVNDRTLVPARFVAEAFDCDVQWDGNTKTVYITTKEVDYSKVEQGTTQKPSESKNSSSSKSDNSTTVSSKEEDTVTTVDKTQNSTSGYRVETIENSAMRVRTIKGNIQGWIDPKKYETDLYLSTQVGNDIYYIGAEAGRALVYVFNILSGDTKLYCDFSDYPFELDGEQGNDWEIVNCIYSIFYDQSQKAVCVYASADHNDVLKGRAVERDVVFNLKTKKATSLTLMSGLVKHVYGTTLSGDYYVPSTGYGISKGGYVGIGGLAKISRKEGYGSWDANGGGVGGTFSASITGGEILTLPKNVWDFIPGDIRISGSQLYIMHNGGIFTTAQASYFDYINLGNSEVAALHSGEICSINNSYVVWLTGNGTVVNSIDRDDIADFDGNPAILYASTDGQTLVFYDDDEKTFCRITKN